MVALVFDSDGAVDVVVDIVVAFLDDTANKEDDDEDEDGAVDDENAPTIRRIDRGISPRS
jgi:hypothetical protein